MATSQVSVTLSVLVSVHSSLKDMHTLQKPLFMFTISCKFGSTLECFFKCIKMWFKLDLEISLPSCENISSFEKTKFF